MPARKATRDTKKALVANTIISNETIDGPLFQPSLRMIAPNPRSVELMEKVKSKIESFDCTGQIQLLRQILALYASCFSCDANKIGSLEKTFDAFRTQITENQNGIFLNLTSCSDELWNACIYSVNQLERQANDLEKLDRERAVEVAKLKKACKVTKVKLATSLA